MNFIKQVDAAVKIDNPFQTGPLSGASGQAGLNQIINTAISIVFLISGLLFLAMMFSGGISWITAGGDPKSVAAARAKLQNAFIGLIIVVGAFALTQLILAAFGLDTFINIAAPPESR